VDVPLVDDIQFLENKEGTGLTGIHFHHLRHAGNLLTAHAAANLRKLMERMATRPAGPR
jgi:chromosomal replication initiation ATPase DnaA